MDNIYAYLIIVDISLCSLIIVIHIYQFYCDIKLVRIRALEEGRRVVLWPRGSKRRRARWCSVALSFMVIPAYILVILNGPVQATMFFVFWYHPLLIYCCIMVAEIFTKQVHKQFQKLLPDWHEELFKKTATIVPTLYSIVIILFVVIDMQGLLAFAGIIVFAASITVGTSVFVALRLVSSGVRALVGDAKMMFAVDKDRETYLRNLVTRTQRITVVIIMLMIFISAISFHFTISVLKEFTKPLQKPTLFVLEFSFVLGMLLIVMLLRFSWIPRSKIRRKSLVRIKIMDSDSSKSKSKSKSNESNEEGKGKVAEEMKEEKEEKEMENVANPKFAELGTNSFSQSLSLSLVDNGQQELEFV